MYKDKDKQKEANRAAKAKWKAKQGIPEAEGIPVEYPDEQGIPRIVKGGICWCCGNDIPINTTCCGTCSWSGRAQAKRAGRRVLRIGEPAYEDMITKKQTARIIC